MVPAPEPLPEVVPLELVLPEVAPAPAAAPLELVPPAPAGALAVELLPLAHAATSAAVATPTPSSAPCFAEARLALSSLARRFVIMFPIVISFRPPLPFARNYGAGKANGLDRSEE
jgi:hypothetical protein